MGSGGGHEDAGDPDQEDSGTPDDPGDATTDPVFDAGLDPYDAGSDADAANTMDAADAGERMRFVSRRRHRQLHHR